MMVNKHHSFVIDGRYDWFITVDNAGLKGYNDCLKIEKLCNIRDRCDDGDQLVIN